MSELIAPFATSENPYGELASYRAHYLEAVQEAQLTAVGLWRAAHEARSTDCFPGFYTYTDGLLTSCLTDDPVAWRQVETIISPSVDNEPMVIRRMFHDDAQAKAGALKTRTTESFLLIPGGTLFAFEEVGFLQDDGTYALVPMTAESQPPTRTIPLSEPIVRSLTETLQRIDGSYVEPPAPTLRQTLGGIMGRIIRG